MSYDAVKLALFLSFKAMLAATREFGCRDLWV